MALQTIRFKRTATPNTPPVGLVEGEPAVEMVSTPPKLWVGVPAGQVLLNPPAIVTSDTPPAPPIPGQLWWNSSLGKTFTWYTDANSSQWVEV